MNLAEYRAKLTKEVTCPSGANAVIRQLSSGDLLKSLGSVPGLNTGRIKDSDLENINPEQMISIQRIYLCKGVVSFMDEKLKIVDGVPGEGEYPWSDILSDDASFLVNEIAELTNPVRKMEDRAPEGARFSQEAK